MQPIFASCRNTRPLLPDSWRFVRSDVPAAVREEERRWMLERGLRTVVDLRQPQERRQKPCPLDEDARFVYLCLPVTGGNAVPSCPQEVPLSYLQMADAQMEHILSTIWNAEGGVLFFCNAGKDRTGVVSALLLRRLGKSREYILRDYLQSAENLREMLEAYARGTGTDIRIITPQPEYMETFLDRAAGFAL